jgi:hypothetical protein
MRSYHADSTLSNRSSTGLEAFCDRCVSLGFGVWRSAQIFVRRRVNPTSFGVQIAQKGARPRCSQGNQNLLVFVGAVTALVCASLDCRPVTHKIPPSRRSSTAVTHTKQTLFLILPTPQAFTHHAHSKSTTNKQNKANNNTPSHQPRLNHLRSADEHLHPLYPLHLPIKQQWVLCGLKALAESTPVSQASSLS